MEEVTDSVKRSDLLRYGIDYGREKFYDTGPGLVGYKNMVIYQSLITACEICKITNTYDNGFKIKQ